MKTKNSNSDQKDNAQGDKLGQGQLDLLSTELGASSLVQTMGGAPVDPQTMPLAPSRSSLVVVVRNHVQERERASRNRQTRLFEEAMAVEAADALEADALGFVPKWLVHATLPYQQPKGNPPAWGRRSGNVSLMIQPAYYQREVPEADGRGRPNSKHEMVSIGYPSGPYPRLVLAWIGTEVVQKKSRNLVLGQSAAEFMTTVGIESVNGGVRGTHTAFRLQMQRLFGATISVSMDPTIAWHNEGFRITDSSITEEWWAQPGTRQGNIWRTQLRLSERFFETLVNNPIPVDLRVVRALSRSAMAMDIYTWLTYRNACISRPTTVPWEALMVQFGSEASRSKFRELFEKNLKSVLAVYPQAKVSTSSSGILLVPSQPSVRKVAR